MNETYQDAKLLAMDILKYIDAVEKQGGNERAMLNCIFVASIRCEELKFKLETLKIQLNK